MILAGWGFGTINPQNHNRGLETGDSEADTVKKACIVGCGGISKVHFEALKQISGVSLTGCADIVFEKAAYAAEAYGCAPFSSLEQMLEEVPCDVLHICTPHYLHGPMTLEAAGRRIDVIEEKPPVISRDQWIQLEQASRQIRIGVCFQNRYNAPVIAAKRIIDSEEYGKLLSARAFVTWNRGKAYYASGDWRGKWETEGGGALINQSIHTLDLLLWFMGTPQTVACRMSNHRLQGIIEVEDTVEARLTFEGERMALFYASNGYACDAPVLLELRLERAVLRLEGEKLYIMDENGITTVDCPEGTGYGKACWGTGHLKCIADFYDALESNRPYQNDLMSAANTVDVMLKMYEQARQSGI